MDQASRRLLLTLALKRSCAASVVERPVIRAALHNPVDSWPIDSSSEDQHKSRLGAHHQVLLVDGTFDSAGLIRSLEVTFDVVTILLEVQILRRCAPVWIVAVESPSARNICR